MGPGPSNAYPEVTMALAGPVLGHLDPQFLAMLDSTNDRLRQVFATSNALTLPLSGTGSAGMEASFVNFVRPGDPVVVGVNGVFGERMCEVACRHGADVLRVDADWGEPVDPDRLLGAHPVSGDDRCRACRDLNGGAQRHRVPGPGQGRRSAPGGHGHVTRGNRGGRRRLVGRHRLQRNAEVSRRPARPLALHCVPAGRRAHRRAPLELVPRSATSWRATSTTSRAGRGSITTRRR